MTEEKLEPLYQASDMEEIKRQIRRTLTVFGVFSAIAVIAIVLSLIYRLQWLTIAITLLWGTLMLFFWSMKLSPPLAYRKYLREIHIGLSHTTTGTLVEISPDPTFRDGLNFHAFILNIGEQNDPDDDRLFYWDNQKPLPALVQGEKLTIQSHGNDIIGLCRLP